MIRRPPRSTLSSSSAASDVYKRQVSCKALLDLKSLLQGTLLPESDVVLEAEHRCLLLQEVLMRRSLNRQRVAQLKLFHPRHQSPAWQGLPREIRLNHNVCLLYTSP